MKLIRKLIIFTIAIFPLLSFASQYKPYIVTFDIVNLTQYNLHNDFFAWGIGGGIDFKTIKNPNNENKVRIVSSVIPGHPMKLIIYYRGADMYTEMSHVCALEYIISDNMRASIKQIPYKESATPPSENMACEVLGDINSDTATVNIINKI